MRRATRGSSSSRTRRLAGTWRRAERPFRTIAESDPYPSQLRPCPTPYIVLAAMQNGKRTRGQRAEGDREWMGQVGYRLRHLRGALGLSQEEIARSAGVSQGAISRLERGLGVATPFMAVLRVVDAMASRLRGMDPTLLSESSNRWLKLQRELATMRGVSFDIPNQVFRDDELEHVVRGFSGLVQNERAVVTAVLKALAGNRAASSDTSPRAASHAS
jgi:transcriptional regulator with XRE-family HTH domain